MAKYIRAIYIRGHASSVSLSAFKEKKIEIITDPRTRKRIERTHPCKDCTTIVSDGGRRHHSLPEGEVLPEGYFLVQDIPENKEALLHFLKKEWVQLEDIELENKLLGREEKMETIEVNLEEQVTEKDLTIPGSPADKADKETQAKERMAELREKKKAKSSNAK